MLYLEEFSFLDFHNISDRSVKSLFLLKFKHFIYFKPFKNTNPLRKGTINVMLSDPPIYKKRAF